jgi:hypothetical protein
LELRDVVEHGDGVFSATLIHRHANLTVEQDFSARILTDDALGEVLGSAGFDLVGRLTADARWVLAAAKA